MLVPVIRYSSFIYLCSFYSLLIIRLFCSLFDYLFCFHSHWFFAYLLFKKEKNNSDPEPCSGISISLNRRSNLLPVQVPVVPDRPSSSLRVNKHHTADSTDFVLVQERRTYYHHRHSGIDETNILQVQSQQRGETFISVRFGEIFANVLLGEI